MGFRSRALLTGVATGFLKANNDRRDRMAQRLQELSDNRALMDRERAKSRADAASKAAAEEHSQWASLRANDFIDDEGNYQKKYFDKVAYAEFQKKETREAFGGNFQQFADEFKKTQGTKFIRQYKDPEQIESSLRNVYDSIDTRQRSELSRPAMTGFDAMLGSVVNRVTSSVGLDKPFGPPSDGTLSSEPTAELNVMQEQGPMEPAAPYERPNFKGPEVAPEKAEKWIRREDGTWVVAFADSAGGNTIVNTGVKGYDTDQGFKDTRPSMTDSDQKWYVNGIPVPNVKEVTYVDEHGVKQTEKGVLNEQGKFVKVPELSPFSDVDKPKEELDAPYTGEHNIKAVSEAHMVLEPAVNAYVTLNNIKSTYNPADYGSEQVLSEVGNMKTALFRMTNIGFSGGYTEKAKVLEAMSKGAAFQELPPEMQDAIMKKDLNTISALSKQYSDAELQEVYAGFEVIATTEQEQEILSELRAQSVSAEMQPLVRDLLRAWTGGDKKPAWGAAEQLLKTLQAGSTPEKLLAQVDVYKRNMAMQVRNQMQVKWDASKYSMSNNVGNGFAETDFGDFSGTELRRNRKTGQFLLIKTGTNSKGELVRYFIPSDSKSVLEAKQPVKGKEFTTKDQNMYRYTNRMLDDFNEILNNNGRPIN